MSVMPNNNLDLKDFIITGDREYCVSTVYLFVKHYGNTWYETMIFKAKDKNIINYTELFCKRYETETEAISGHDDIVSLLKAEKLELNTE